MTNVSALKPRFLDAGDAGLVVEYGEVIDEAINARVVALDAALAERNLPGVRETVPTYRSLLILFDPLELSRQRLKDEIARLPVDDGHAGERRRWRVPVRYGGEHGVDLETVAASHDMDRDELVSIHAGAEYRVYIIGFAPGFVYLGGLPERIHTGRRSDPRMKTPPRSISIGGAQTAVSPPMEIPSGWHLIGRTPVRSYDPRDTARPFVFAAGDTIRFEPVSAAAYDDLCAAVEAGHAVATWDPIDD